VDGGQVVTGTVMNLVLLDARGEPQIMLGGTAAMAGGLPVGPHPPGDPPAATRAAGGPVTGDRDAIVIGGGPGGAACAATLARGGRRVLLLEQARSARDHVGESLSPSAWLAAERFGVSEELRSAGFAPKLGATFAWGDDPYPWTVAYPMVGEQPSAYQVRRAEFDSILLGAATAAGAEVRHGWRAQEITYSSGRPSGVLATSSDGEPVRLTAPWVVDASGAPGLLSADLERLPGPAELDNTAIWGYWRRSEESPLNGCANSLLVGRQDCCIWYYPLDERAGLVSVGVVVRGGARQELALGMEDFYLGEVGSCAELRPVLSGAVLAGQVQAGDARAYASPRMAGPGWFLVGDAACFVDALLTPGVQLAIQQGTLAAQCLLTIFERSAAQAQALELYDHVVRREYETFVWLSRNMYSAAGPAREPGKPPGQAPVPEANGQFALLSLVSGLPRTELAVRLGAYMSLRHAAAQRAGTSVVLGEKEGFAFLGWLFHQDNLASERAGLIAGELDESCVLRPAPGVAVGDEAFVPADGAQTLRYRTAVRNRLGDRFEATKELVTVLGVLGTGCTYAEARRRFCQASATADDAGDVGFRDWIELLADNALLEWKPAGEGTACAA
jgi:flavin-dependent dehydrogenase